MIEIFITDLTKYIIPFLSFIFLLGIISYPVTKLFFSKNIDGGFTNSYILGFLSIAWFGFTISTLKTFSKLSFNLDLSTAYLYGILIWVVINFIILKKQNYNWKIYEINKIFSSIFITTSLTLLFYFIFSFYSFYNPQGSETHLNIGILNSINYSNQIPINDFWLSGYSFNYYYFSHYAISMLSQTLKFDPVIDFNFISIIYLVLFSTSVITLVNTIIKIIYPEVTKIKLLIATLITFSITFLINPLKSIYGLIELSLNLNTAENILSNYSDYSIRIISGTIAENFNYSFLVNPLHALSNNLVVGVLILNVLFFLVEKKEQLINSQKEIFLLFILIGFAGLINTWDVIAYLGLFIVTVGYFSYNLILKRPGYFFKRGVLMLYPTILIMFPWFIYFQSPSGIPNIVKYVSNLVQWFNFWGVYFISFLVLFSTSKKVLDKTKFSHLLLFYGLGLILFLEIFYFMDIMRDSEYFRANTYYKFSNIVILLFSVSLSVNFILYIFKEKNILIKIFLAFFIYSTFWFNIILFSVRVKKHKYTGINSQSDVVLNYNPELLNLITYLKQNMKPKMVIWEGSNNKAYTYSNFVSVMTGIPTVLGWSNHEVTWRNMAYFYETIKQREDDTKEFFSGDNLEIKKELIKKYNVNYVILGKSEREMYQDSLKSEMISTLGDIVFEENDTKLIKIVY